jgi:excisionase family DNA binding protein
VDEKKFLTIAETSATTGVAESTLRTLAGDGRLPIVRFGRGIRVPVVYLDMMAADAVARLRRLTRPDAEQ